MDALDHKMLAILSADGRISITDLADELPLSISATRDRLKRLEASGAIDGFSVRVNAAALGRTIEALVDVRLGPSILTADAESQIRAMTPVVDAMHLSGRFDMQLYVVARDVAELDHLLTQLREDVGAEETNSRLVLRTLEGFPRNPLG